MASIAFLACNKRADRYLQDPSFIYRCMNLSLAAKELGHRVWSGHVSMLPWAQHWDVVVFHRPSANLRFKATLAWLRLRGARILADVDDLIMDPELAPFSPGVSNQLVGLHATQKQFAANRDALACVDGVSVSTQPLAEQVRRVLPGVDVMVMPNAVHQSWWSLPLHPRDGAVKAITYLPGTRSHDRDFAEVAPAVARVLRRHPQVLLRVTGPLNFSLDARAGQIIRKDKLPFDRYHDSFAGAAINLAPLESTPFTRCKSALKVIEAAWWNVPTVCSDLPDAARFDGAGAQRVSGVAEFEDRLEHLLGDSAAYAALANGLRERVRPLADIHALTGSWLAFALGRGQA